MKKLLFLILGLFNFIISYSEYQYMTFFNMNEGVGKVIFSDNKEKFLNNLSNITPYILVDKNLGNVLGIDFKNIEKRIYTDELKVILDGNIVVNAEVYSREEQLTDIHYGEIVTLTFKNNGLDILNKIAKSKKVEIEFKSDLGKVTVFLTNQEKEILNNTIKEYERSLKNEKANITLQFLLYALAINVNLWYTFSV